MPELRRCEGCGKDYWWPAARWQHEACEVRREGRKVSPVKQRWAREKYNAWMRDYLRKRRAKRLG